VFALAAWALSGAIDDGRYDDLEKQGSSWVAHTRHRRPAHCADLTDVLAHPRMRLIARGAGNRLTPTHLERD
jgi:hypothetical protein